MRDTFSLQVQTDFPVLRRSKLGAGQIPRIHLSGLLKTDIEGCPIRVAEHCYGCTAGQGSGCGGALARNEAAAAASII